MLWEKHDRVFILQGTQRDSNWFKAHRGRISASGVINAMGMGKFKTVEEYLLSLSSNNHEHFPHPARIRMQNGVVREERVRRWFEKEYRLAVIEISMGVPDWEPYIGASPDGKIVGRKEGIEIKTTNNIASYERLRRHIESEGTTISSQGVIFDSHYSQMQLNMAVFNWDKMWYIVHDYTNGTTIVAEVLRDVGYIVVMIHLARKFIKDLLIPKIDEDPSYLPAMPLCDKDFSCRKR